MDYRENLVWLLIVIKTWISEKKDIGSADNNYIVKYIVFAHKMIRMTRDEGQDAMLCEDPKK